MSDHKDADPDHFNETIKYSPEDQTRTEWDNESNNIDDFTSRDNDPTAQKLWLSFQTSATSTAQLYKDGLAGTNSDNLWKPFKKAAASVATLYTDSLSARQVAYEQGQLVGQRKRTRDVIAWMKKRGRRNIRRDELMALLTGHPIHPLRHDNASMASIRMASSQGHSGHAVNNHQPLKQQQQQQQTSMATSTNAHASEHHELQPFHDALVLQGINGAMSAVSVRSGMPSSSQDLDRTILDNLGRQIREGKRSREPTSDSPTKNKRSRYY